MAKPQQTSWTEDDVRDATTIEPLQIQEEYVRVPGDLAHWSGAYADAQEAYLRQKLAREVEEATVRLALRTEAGGRGDKLTEGKLDELMSVDPRYIAACQMEISAEARKLKAYGIVDAVRSKRDMLVSLGAHLRQEHDPQINRDKKSR